MEIICSRCSNGCANEEDLWSHISVRHLGWLPYECIYCESLYATKTEVLAHLDEKHKGQKQRFVAEENDGKMESLKKIFQTSLEAQKSHPLPPQIVPPPAVVPSSVHDRTAATNTPAFVDDSPVAAEGCTCADCLLPGDDADDTRTVGAKQPPRRAVLTESTCQTPYVEQEAAGQDRKRGRPKRASDDAPPVNMEDKVFDSYDDNDDQLDLKISEDAADVSLSPTADMEDELASSDFTAKPPLPPPTSLRSKSKRSSVDSNGGTAYDQTKTPTAIDVSNSLPRVAAKRPAVTMVDLSDDEGVPPSTGTNAEDDGGVVVVSLKNKAKRRSVNRSGVTSTSGILGENESEFDRQLSQIRKTNNPERRKNTRRKSVPAASSNNPKYACRHCGFSSYDRSTLSHHLATRHFVCPKCPFLAFDNNTLRAHIRICENTSVSAAASSTTFRPIAPKPAKSRQSSSSVRGSTATGKSRVSYRSKPLKKTGSPDGHSSNTELSPPPPLAPYNAKNTSVAFLDITDDETAAPSSTFRVRRYQKTSASTGANCYKYCRKCSKVCATELEAKQHLMMKHLDVRDHPYVCPHCGIRASVETDIIKHIRVHHVGLHRRASFEPNDDFNDILRTLDGQFMIRGDLAETTSVETSDFNIADNNTPIDRALSASPEMPLAPQTNPARGLDVANETDADGGNKKFDENTTTTPLTRTTQERNLTRSDAGTTAPFCAIQAATSLSTMSSASSLAENALVNDLAAISSPRHASAGNNQPSQRTDAVEFDSWMSELVESESAQGVTTHTPDASLQQPETSVKESTVLSPPLFSETVWSNGATSSVPMASDTRSTMSVAFVNKQTTPPSISNDSSQQNLNKQSTSSVANVQSASSAATPDHQSAPETPDDESSTPPALDNESFQFVTGTQSPSPLRVSSVNGESSLESQKQLAFSDPTAKIGMDGQELVLLASEIRQNGLVPPIRPDVASTESKPDVSNKPCSICSFQPMSNDYQLLRSHVAVMHFEGARYECSACALSSGLSRRKVTRHVTESHADDRDAYVIDRSTDAERQLERLVADCFYYAAPAQPTAPSPPTSLELLRQAYV